MRVPRKVERTSLVPVVVPNHEISAPNPENSRGFNLPRSLNVTYVKAWVSRLVFLFTVGTYILSQTTSSIPPAVVKSITDVLGPLCTVTAFSAMPICAPQWNTTTPFLTLVEQQIRFVSAMDSASLNSNLALDLMHTEMAVKDLKAEIKLSNVESKDALIRSFDNIADIASEGNQQLIVLQAGVGNAVDSISAMNEWGVDALQAIEVHVGRSFISDAIFPFRSPPIGRDEIIETFDAIADLMETKLYTLIDMAQMTVTTLSNLKGEFGTVQEIRLRAVKSIELQRDQVLAMMGTLSEEHRAKLEINMKHLDLLAGVEKYRSTAASTVGDTLMQLRELQADLVNLRADVKSQSSRQKVKPQLEVIMMTLRNGAQRLSRARAMARSKDAQSRKRMFYGAQVPELDAQSSTA